MKDLTILSKVVKCHWCVTHIERAIRIYAKTGKVHIEIREDMDHKVHFYCLDNE